MMADIIKELRTGANLTQSELARKLGISRSSVNAWEMGISSPSTQYLIELSSLFKVSTDYILGISPEHTINIDGFTREEINIINMLIQRFEKD